jgi:hypothetical protein
MDAQGQNADALQLVDISLKFPEGQVSVITGEHIRAFQKASTDRFNRISGVRQKLAASSSSG